MPSAAPFSSAWNPFFGPSLSKRLTVRGHSILVPPKLAGVTGRFRTLDLSNEGLACAWLVPKELAMAGDLHFPECQWIHPTINHPTSHPSDEDSPRQNLRKKYTRKPKICQVSTSTAAFGEAWRTQERRGKLGCVAPLNGKGTSVH